MKDDLTYLHHIYDAVETIFEYLEGIDFPQFQTEKIRIDAVMRELMIIGEAASYISDGFKKKHPSVQWKKFAECGTFWYTSISASMSKWSGIHTATVCLNCMKP